jgi:cytochrome P450
MLCYASANRDESVIEDGAAFRIDRGKTEHMAFGFGPHVCLGQHLARQEMKALFERLLPAIRSVRLDGDGEMSQSYFVNGLKRLPIRFELQAR